MTDREGRLRLGLLLMGVATALRLTWALAVPTIPVGDFAMYRESASYLVEHGSLDGGFIYMPGFVLLLAALQAAGGEVLSAKVLGALFGGLAAGPLFLLTARIADQSRGRATVEPGAPAAAGAAWGRHLRADIASSPAAFVAGVLYALWPGGVSLASVVGTDIPAAALLLLALGVLAGWGPTRPLLAAVGFGALTGLAAYIRAVALPLTVLSAGYWLACGARGRAVAVRTALSVGVTLLVLSPWAVRNLRSDGELSFTDHHGGVTALMGNYPNTEGTYARSLNIMFKELTGRTFLSQPHRETDRSAYAIAKTWIRFDPAWTAGMVALRLERLFAAEHGLLYWSVYRPGVLPEGPAAWFGRHRALITEVADAFYVAFAVWVCAGLAFTVLERRWVALVPVACALLLAGTYALFVAEPRYRVTTEVLLFPSAGLGLHRLAAGALQALRALRGRVRSVAAAAVGREPVAGVFGASWWKGGAATLLLAAALLASGVAVVVGGRSLREGHRWAVSLWHVDGVPHLAYWRAPEGAGARAGSPIVGVPEGAGLRVSGGASATAAAGGAGSAEAGAEVTLPDLPSWRGPTRLRAALTWWPTGADPAARLEIGSLVVPGGTTAVDGILDLGGQDGATGTAHLAVRLVVPSAPRRETTVVIRDVVFAHAGDDSSL